MIRFHEERHAYPFPLSRQLSLRHTDGRDFRGAILPGSPSPDCDSPPSTCKHTSRILPTPAVNITSWFLFVKLKNVLRIWSV